MKPPRRLRFSLLSLAAWMTIAALAVGLYSSARRNARLDALNETLAAENKSYRDQLGIFDIEDPQKFHAIRMPVEDGMPRRYRVYLPPGHQYDMHYKANGIPEQGVPAESRVASLEPGSYVFSVTVKRMVSEQTGDPLPQVLVSLRYEGMVNGESYSSTHAISVGEEKNDWIINNETGHTSYGWQEINGQLEIQGTESPLVLYRARAKQVEVQKRNANGKPERWSTKDIKGACDGFMVWIASDEQ